MTFKYTHLWWRHFFVLHSKSEIQVSHSALKQRFKLSSVPSVHFPPQHLPCSHSSSVAHVSHSFFLKHFSRDAAVSKMHLLSSQSLVAQSKSELQEAHSGSKHRPRLASVPSVHFPPQHLPCSHSSPVVHVSHSFFLKHFSRDAAVSKMHSPSSQSVVAHSPSDKQVSHSSAKQFLSDSYDPSVHLLGDPQHFPWSHCSLLSHGAHSGRRPPYGTDVLMTDPYKGPKMEKRASSWQKSRKEVIMLWCENTLTNCNSGRGGESPGHVGAFQLRSYSRGRKFRHILWTTFTAVTIDSSRRVWITTKLECLEQDGSEQWLCERECTLHDFHQEYMLRTNASRERELMKEFWIEARLIHSHIMKMTSLLNISCSKKLWLPFMISGWRLLAPALITEDILWGISLDIPSRSSEVYVHIIRYHFYLYFWAYTTPSSPRIWQLLY